MEAAFAAIAFNEPSAAEANLAILHLVASLEPIRRVYPYVPNQTKALSFERVVAQGDLNSIELRILHVTATNRGKASSDYGLTVF